MEIKIDVFVLHLSILLINIKTKPHNYQQYEYNFSLENLNGFLWKTMFKLYFIYLIRLFTKYTYYVL